MRLAYELVGRLVIDNTPTKLRDSSATTTAQKTFLNVDDEWERALDTVTFHDTSRSTLAAGHYSGQTRAWHECLRQCLLTAQLGIWHRWRNFCRKKFYRAAILLKTITQTLALEESSCGIYITVAASYTGKQLKLKDDGNLVVSDTDGSNVIWMSPNAFNN